MTEAEVVSILMKRGWHGGRDEVGDRFCIMELEGALLQVIPTVRKRRDHFRISLMPSISTKEFSDAVAMIAGEKPSFWHIISVWNDTVLEVSSISDKDVIRLAEETISWAKAQNIEKGLQKYRELPTDAKGARPLWHLAALAVAGDIKRLMFYQSSFDKNERLNFVPYITKDYIDRAVLLGIKG